MYYIFDTNFYLDIAANRNFSEVIELMDTIKQKESEKGIKSMMCSVVAQELISHLLDNGGGSSYLRACVALYLHTGNSQHYDMIPLPELQIAKMIFRVDWKQKIDTQNAYGQILYLLASEKNKSNVIIKYRNEITQTRDYVLDAEANFADEIEKAFQQFDPNFKLGQLPFGSNSVLRKQFLQFIQSQQFEDETLLALLVSAYTILQTQGYALPSARKLRTFIPLLHNFYLRSMVFRRMYFTKFSSNCYDLRADNHSNYIWDERIITAVGNTINGEKIGLITSDNGIKDTLLKFDPNLQIMNTDDYATYLGIVNLKKKKNLYQKLVSKIKKWFRKINFIKK